MRKHGGSVGHYAKGGKVKAKFNDHDEDDMPRRAPGGPVMGLHAKGKAVGAGGGLGRLAKMKKYGV